MKYPGLTMLELEALRKRTGAIFARDPAAPHLIELRWPKPGRRLTGAQEQVLRDALTVVARDSDGYFRSIIFCPRPPAKRSRRGEESRGGPSGTHAVPGA